MDVTLFMSTVNGYVEDGIVVLEIFEALPHTKHLAEELEHWQEMIHSAIDDLANKYDKPFFERAHMGLMVEMLRNPKFKAWDITNRAINLTVNNLKGIFFPDDDVEHLSIISAGRWSAETSKTTIMIGGYPTKYGKIEYHIFQFLRPFLK